MRLIQPFKSFLALIFVLLIAYGLTRGLFFIMNESLFLDVTRSQILKSFILGLRFDLSAIFMVNGILFLSLILFSFSKRSLQLSRIYFTLLNGAFIGLNVMDAEFFKFNGKRFSKDYLENTEDLQRHTLSVFISYWWLFSLFLLSLGLFYFIFPKILKLSSSVQLNLKERAMMSLMVIALTVLAIRGGFQFKPITLVSAYTQGHPGLGSLVLNTPFTFVKGHASHLNEAPVFIDDLGVAKKVIQDFRGAPASQFTPLSDVKNVVVIVVESLSLEYTGLIDGQTSYTPFIDELSKKSIVFTQNYANGRRSIEAMPSIFCGVPSLVAAPLITSGLSQNELHCLPEYFSKSGFETAFFHGAHNGSFHMDSFSSKAGFQKFYGFNEYPDSNDSDGSWGILDEPMLLFMVDQLSSSQNPFFAGVFTLSSHHPYFIPERLRSLFKQGPLEIHKSIGYADYALKMFFEKAQKTKWFKETIFIITADHTQKNHEVSYQYFSGDYRVPMIIYSESNQFKDRFLAERDEYLTKVTQAVDVPHIILELMGVDHRPRLPPFGANTLNKGVKGLAVNYNGFQYWLRSEDRIVAIDPKGQMTENLKVDSKGFLKEKRTANNEINELVDVLKSMVSIFNKSMRQNSLYKEQTPSKE